MSIRDLPTLNAVLNVCASLLLVCGYVLIRRQRRVAHARCMVAAFAVSCAFLVSYLTYHTLAEAMTPYGGQGWLRTVYFVVLFTHIVLAAAVPPLALRTLWLASRKRWDSHRRWARWTLPIWLYVSVTGVVVYLMLYVFPPTDA